MVFHNLILQLPATRQRIHFVRCPVTVHQFSNATLGVSYQGRLLARYDSSGGLLSTSPNKCAPPVRNGRAGQKNAVPAAVMPRTARTLIHISLSPALPSQMRALAKTSLKQATPNPNPYR